jgi:hypothetical protein
MTRSTSGYLRIRPSTQPKRFALLARTTGLQWHLQHEHVASGVGCIPAHDRRCVAIGQSIRESRPIADLVKHACELVEFIDEELAEQSIALPSSAHTGYA